MKTISLPELSNYINAIKSCNAQWNAIHNESIDTLEGFLPSGSGIDAGCKIDRENSTRNRIIITFDFHHLHENGYYIGWTSHKAILIPSFIGGFDLRITGPDKNGIKDYLIDTFYDCFTV
jgi:hypothetical protein